MQAQKTDLGPEWSLLEAICRPDDEDTRRGRVHELLGSSTMDLTVLVTQAVRHQLLPHLAFTLTEECDADLPGPVHDDLRAALETNRRRSRMHTTGAVEAVRQLAAHGITVVATKGVVLEATMYGDRGLRKMTDADLMIHPSSRDAVVELMTALGYRSGVYDRDRHAITDLPAQVRTLYRLSPSHLPHFRRLAERRGEFQDIDVANSITWARSEWEVPMADVLAETATVDVLGGEARLPALVPAWHFVFVVLHLFRESWMWRDERGPRDALYRYGDILRMWHRDRDALVARLPVLIGRYDLARPMGWVLEHTDRTFGSGIMSDLGLAGSLSEAWLSSSNGTGGRGWMWTGTMRDRLHRADIATLLRPADDRPM